MSKINKTPLRNLQRPLRLLGRRSGEPRSLTTSQEGRYLIVPPSHRKFGPQMVMEDMVVMMWMKRMNGMERKKKVKKLKKVRENKVFKN